MVELIERISTDVKYRKGFYQIIQRRDIAGRPLEGRVKQTLSETHSKIQSDRPPSTYPPIDLDLHDIVNVNNVYCCWTCLYR